jgi:hypothetical protein
MTLQDADPGDIPAFLDRRPFIGTFTNLKGFINCEHAMFRRYIKKDQVYRETPEMTWGNEVHDAMEKRVGKGKVLPDKMRDWEKHAAPFDQYQVICEEKLGMTSGGRATGFWDNDVWFRGKNDVTVMLNDKALLTDWKTSDPKYEDPFELQTNALLLKAKYPNLRTIIGRYVYLKHDHTGRMHDLSDFKGTWAEINRLMNLITEKRKTGNWEKRKSGLCGWCSVEDCEHWFISEKRKI